MCLSPRVRSCLQRLQLWTLLSLPVLLPACAAESPAPGQVQAKHAQPVLVHGGEPVAAFVAAQQRDTSSRVLVYVGASWCEPCRYFHDALLAGELDGLLAGTRVIEYDRDQSEEQLAAAGYRSRMIPLFVLPRADGSASEHAMEGSVKGPAAVQQNLVPRLKRLLANRGS